MIENRPLSTKSPCLLMSYFCTRMKISASVYSGKDQSIASIVKELDQYGIDYFHIDCNNDPAVFEDIERIREISKTPIDLHIISPHPDAFLYRAEELGVELVTLQYEVLETLDLPHNLNAKLGLGIVSDTDISVFDAYADRFDFILMMATVPGQSGGKFDKINFRKIRKFRQKYYGKAIHVDGGVNAEVSFILRNLGVQASVVGSYLFKGQPVGAALLNLKTNDIESHYMVKDFMRNRDEIPLLGPDKRALKDVLESIEQYRLGFTILENEAQEIEGIVSNADVRRGLLKHLADPSEIKVADLVNNVPITIQEDSTVEAMLKKVKGLEYPVNFMPVTNRDRKVTGVVSFLNLIKGEL